MSAIGPGGMYGQRLAAATRPTRLMPTKQPGSGLMPPPMPTPPPYGLGSPKPMFGSLPMPPARFVPGRLQAPPFMRGRVSERGVSR